jgi:hypothetical protein
LHYCTAFKAGGPIIPLNYFTQTWSAFRWDFPILDFKFVNNARDTLFLSEVVFEIEESRPDRTPFFAIKKDTQRRHAGDLLLINEGWCNLTDVSVRFNLLPEVAAAPKLTPPFSHTRTIPVLADREEIDVTGAFQQEGADIDGLILLQNGEWESQDIFVVTKFDETKERIVAAEFHDRMKEYLGPFQDSVGTLAGEISFATTEDANRRYQVNFQAVVYLDNLNQVGILKPPSWAGNVKFDPQNTAYKRSVKISHEIKPGDTERFTIKIAIPQSSSHRFRATVRDIAGLDLASLPIEMKCFVPRSKSG